MNQQKDKQKPKTGDSPERNMVLGILMVIPAILLIPSQQLLGNVATIVWPFAGLLFAFGVKLIIGNIGPYTSGKDSLTQPDDE